MDGPVFIKCRVRLVVRCPSPKFLSMLVHTTMKYQPYSIPRRVQEETLPDAAFSAEPPETYRRTEGSLRSPLLSQTSPVIEMRPLRPVYEERTASTNADGIRARRPKGRDSPDAIASWSRCNDALRVHDDAMIKAWKEEIESLPVFAGLFSAVITAFIIETYPALQPNPDTAQILAQISLQLSSLQMAGGTITSTHPPALVQTTIPSVPTSLIVVNALWLTSLVLSLITASIGIIVKQWLREYPSNMTNIGSPRPDIRTRQYRYDGLVNWRVKEIVMLLPLLLQLALILFLIGLEQLVWTLNSVVAIVVTIAVAGYLAFIWITAILPAVDETCPYKSPQALVVFKFWQWQKSSARMASGFVYDLVSFFPIHLQPRLQRSIDLWQREIKNYRNWDEREESYIAKARSSLDRRALLSVFNIRWMDNIFLETSLRPCLNDSELDTTIACFHDILQHSSEATSAMTAFAVDIMARINEPEVIAKYVSDHEEHILSFLMFVLDYYYLHEVSLDPRTFSALTTLLKVGGRITKRAWNLIKCFAHRFDTVDVKGVDALNMYAKRAQFEMDLDPQAFLEYCFVPIQLSTLLYNDDLEYTRSSLTDILQGLRMYLRTLSSSTMPSPNLLNPLADHIPALLELARKDTSLVTLELVDALEDIARTFEEHDDPFMSDYEPRRSVAKKRFNRTVRDLRELKQQSTGSRAYQALPLVQPMSKHW